MQNTEEIWRLVDAKKDEFAALSDRVWGMPEIAYTEHRSAAEHLAMLQAQGFRITRNLAAIPTAVMGEAGEKRPVEANGHGHGCGHNLLGSASLLAATAVKDYLAKNGLKGRVRYYGCPAEEGGATYAIGTPGHSWQLTAQGKTKAAHKGLAHVAKVMAGTTIDVLRDETLLARAKADHAARIGAHPYVCPVPDDVAPPVRMSEAAE